MMLAQPLELLMVKEALRKLKMSCESLAVSVKVLSRKDQGRLFSTMVSAIQLWLLVST